MSTCATCTTPEVCAIAGCQKTPRANAYSVAEDMMKTTVTTRPTKRTTTPVSSKG